MHLPSAPVRINLTLNDNQLQGSIPPLLFNAASTSTTRITFEASRNRISGTLPPSLCNANTSSDFRLDSNALTGSIPNEWQNCRLHHLHLSRNSMLSGTVPPALLSATELQTIDLSRCTSLSGPAPSSGSTLRSVVLSRTYLEFCNQLTALPTNLEICSLMVTDSCRCTAQFPANCQISCSCLRHTQPSSDFECIDGTWVAVTTTVPIITIPAGAGGVIVTENLNSSTIIIGGIDASIDVKGCATDLSTITIDLSDAELTKLGKSKKLLTLISTSGSNCSSLDQVKLDAKSSGCKRIKVERVASEDGAILSAYFALDSSHCNTWWIILVSVVCGIVLLAIIAIVLLSIFSKPFREKIRPYSRARAPAV